MEHRTRANTAADKREGLVDDLVTHLRKLILGGQYSPGNKLPSERELAEEFDVNRKTLREAIKQLEYEGMVQCKANAGTRVRNFRETGGVELIAHLLPQPGMERTRLVLDVVEIMLHVVPSLARLAASRRTDDELEELRVIATRARAPKLAGADIIRLDWDFYAVFIGATRNRAYNMLFNSARTMVDVCAHFLVNQALQNRTKMWAHHQAIIEALEARDADATERATADYFSILKRFLESRLEELCAITDIAEGANPLSASG